MRLSLRVKWTGVVLFIGVVPLLVVAVLVGRIQREGLFRAEQELENAVVDEASRVLSRSLSDGQEAVHRAAVVLAVARIDEDARLALAREAVNGSEIVASAAIFAPDGSLIGAIEKLNAGGAPRELPAAFGREARPRWLWARAPSASASLQLLEPVMVDGAVTAWVLGTMRPEVISERVVELSRSRFGREDRLLVIDRELRVVAGEAVRWPAGSRLDAGIIGAARLDAASFDAVGYAKTTTYVGVNGEAMVGTIRIVPSIGWAVAVERPESEAFGALTRARRAFWFAATGLALIAFGIGALLARSTTRPIKDLVALTRAYGKRDFLQRSSIRSGDELEELGDSLGKMAEDLTLGEAEIRRRITVEAGLSRYLPAEVASAVAAGTGSLALGGRRVPVSIVFADAAAFTTFAEKAQPEVVVALLNELFTVLSEVVFRHGGMVDKFMGDCIMAVFGAHGEAQGDHVTRALAAAEDMHRFVEASAPRWKRDYDYDLQLGIGLSTGEALVGNLGSEKRMEFTAVGDSVNIAARLETLARPGQTLVTADVARDAGTKFEFHSLGMHPLRGKSLPLEVLEVLT